MENKFLPICKQDMIDRGWEQLDFVLVTGKLLKYDFDNDKKLNVIDSVGIAFNHYRQGIDIGQNEVDEGKYEEDKSYSCWSGC